MKNMDEIIQILQDRYNFYNRKDSCEDSPWDRGYRTGYADALQKAIGLLKCKTADNGDDSDVCCDDDTEIAIKWSIDDIDSTISMYEMVISPELTKQEKAHILHEAKNHHNACVGINWEVLYDLIKAIYGNRVVSDYSNS